jgi:hypothetical protein
VGQAAELTPEAVLEALARGHFTLRVGPRSTILPGMGQHEVQVRCSASVAIDFLGNGWRSRRVSAPRGGTLTEASYTPGWGQTYVRVACQDEQGRWAWSNPIMLSGQSTQDPGDR